MADGCREAAGVQKGQNWGYYEAKCLAMQLSALSRKENIWENIAAKLNKRA